MSRATPRNTLAAEIGQQVRDVRTAAGMSQADLAAVMGIHTPTITKIEAGNMVLPFIYGVLIAGLCGKPLTSLVPTEVEAIYGEVRDRVIAQAEADVAAAQERLRALTEVAR